MSTFQLTDAINPNKVFMLSKNEIEKRNDPFYYIPSIAELEKKVRIHNPKPLRDFVLSVASGATPKTSEADKYYSDEENGIPFLRVQNLSPTGLLDLDNVKYINKETHEGMLKRSQVSGGDLLIKITGVGRMAVASVAPEGFVGNTNQHMVVVKTASREISEILAAYLNTDIAEALASRRATGATRPALDYPALLSIPIIYDEKILEIRQKAIGIKEFKFSKAIDVLNGISNYVTSTLNVYVPDYKRDLNNRIFTINYSSVQGQRLDPFYSEEIYRKLELIIKKSENPTKLSSLISFLESGSRPPGGASNINEGILSFGGEHVNNKCEIEVKKEKFIPVEYHQNNLKTATKMNDIILVKDGATTGKIGIITKPEHVGQNVNEHVYIIRTNERCNPFYLMNYLASEVGQLQIKRIITGATVTGLTKDVVKRLLVPLPSIESQETLVDKINKRRDEADNLFKEATNVLIDSKKEVENLILSQNV